MIDKFIQDALIIRATIDPIGTMAIFAGAAQRTVMEQASFLTRRDAAAQLGRRRYGVDAYGIQTQWC